MDIPPEVKIRASIKPGSIYYFPEETFPSDESHYFVVLNVDPIEDELLLLVCASSQVEKREKYRKSIQLPKKTFVIMTPEDYECFTKTTVFNCNELHVKTIQDLVDRVRRGHLVLKLEMDIDHVDRLRDAVLSSPLVLNRYKKMLRR